MIRNAITWSVLGVLAAAGTASAQLSYAGGAYGNNWDSLSTTAPASWINDVGYPGWFLFTSTNAPITQINLNSGGVIGTNGTGSFYAFGLTSSSADRALGGIGAGGAYYGSPASGSIAGYIAFAATNTIGYTLTEFTVGFDGEQWRNGGNTSAQTMVLEYGFGATFASVTTWIAPGGNFDWTSPVVGSTAAAVDGNAAGLVAGRGGTISNLTWNNGDTLWIRWIERNDTGNDHGLAIDNFSFSAVPTPGAAALMGVGALFASRRRRA